jgi:hypothetical protein
VREGVLDTSKDVKEKFVSVANDDSESEEDEGEGGAENGEGGGWESMEE